MRQPSSRARSTGSVLKSDPSQSRWSPTRVGTITAGGDELAVTASTSDPDRCTYIDASVRSADTQKNGSPEVLDARRAAVHHLAALLRAVPRTSDSTGTCTLVCGRIRFHTSSAVLRSARRTSPWRAGPTWPPPCSCPPTRSIGNAGFLQRAEHADMRESARAAGAEDQADGTIGEETGDARASSGRDSRTWRMTGDRASESQRPSRR